MLRSLYASANPRPLALRKRLTSGSRFSFHPLHDTTLAWWTAAVASTTGVPSPAAAANEIATARTPAKIKAADARMSGTFIIGIIVYPRSCTRSWAVL